VPGKLALVRLRWLHEAGWLHGGTTLEAHAMVWGGRTAPRWRLGQEPQVRSLT
jgi:hypothetical protein